MKFVLSHRHLPLWLFALKNEKSISNLHSAVPRKTRFSMIFQNQKISAHICTLPFCAPKILPSNCRPPWLVLSLGHWKIPSLHNSPSTLPKSSPPLGFPPRWKMQLKRIFQIRRGQNRLFEILQGHLQKTGVAAARCNGGAFWHVGWWKTWPLKKGLIRDLQRLGIQRARLESPGNDNVRCGDW